MTSKPAKTRERTRERVRQDTSVPAPSERERSAATNASKRYFKRQGERVRASLRVVLALSDGEKQPATVIDVSTSGMQLDAKRAPTYGEAVTVIIELGRPPSWQIIPARVRWFGKRGFGVEFDHLDGAQKRALEAFVSEASARGLG